jgi:hypothetical protein
MIFTEFNGHSLAVLQASARGVFVLLLAKRTNNDAL